MLDADVDVCAMDNPDGGVSDGDRATRRRSKPSEAPRDSPRQLVLDSPQVTPRHNKRDVKDSNVCISRSDAKCCSDARDVADGAHNHLVKQR